MTWIVPTSTCTNTTAAVLGASLERLRVRRLWEGGLLIPPLPPIVVGSRSLSQDQQVCLIDLIKKFSLSTVKYNERLNDDGR